MYSKVYTRSNYIVLVSSIDGICDFRCRRCLDLVTVHLAQVLLQVECTFTLISTARFIHSRTIMAVARKVCVRGGGGGTGAPVTPVSRGVWGHAPPEKFEI